MKNRLTLNHEMLTGRSSEHLVALNDHHRLQPEAAAAFTTMQLKASQAGFNLLSPPMKKPARLTAR